MKVEVNSEEKIQMEETANKSIINDSDSTKSTGTDSTFNNNKFIWDSGPTRRSSDLQQQISKNSRSDEPPANELLINVRENIGISENESMNNHINENNNNITNEIDSAESDETSPTTKNINRDVVNIFNDNSDNTRHQKTPNTDVGRLVGSLFLMNREKTRNHKIIT